ncbi:MAG TPA: outer membrane beta-barrel protein [Allosphingosinicella sp.]
MKKMLLLAAAAAGAAVPAAAEVPAGFRLEGVVAFDSLKAGVTEGTAVVKRESNGVSYGGAVGYDFPMGTGLALGADAELTFATTDINIAEGLLTVSKDLYVGGRITGSLSDRFNVFAKAGYSNMRLRLDDVDTNPADNPPIIGNLDGYRVGLGVQVNGDSGEYYGVEGRYSDYEGGVSRRQAMFFVGYRF